jgi:branched-chain amino acid transport system permease protein
MSAELQEPRSKAKPARRRRRLGFVDSFLWALRVGAVVVIVWGVIGSVLRSVSGEGLTGEAWERLIVTGLTQGSMYGLIALGYSMVYGVLGFINFAHGEVFTGGALVGFFVARGLDDIGIWNSNPVLAIGLTMLAAVITSMTVAVLVERIAYRPLRGAPRLIPLITSIGMSFFLQYTYRGLFGADIKSYPVEPDALKGTVDIVGLTIGRVDLVVIGVAALSMVALYQFIERTATGRAMRAIAEDKEIASLMGIDVDRTIVTTFAVGGAMAGIAGALWGLTFRNIFFFSGFLPGIKAFTAAVLGGVGNMVGSYVGGVLLGLFESVAPQAVLGGLGIPSVSQLKDVVAFTALVLVLIFRPTGLFGERLAVEERG